jgi:hypothetical protein
VKKSLLALCSVVLLGCASNPMPVSVPSGDWGGHNADLTVTDVGATAQFKCGAVGQVTQALSLDSSGRFSVSGTYDPKIVLGGPRPATFTGSLTGSRLQLSIQTGDTVLGPFDLGRNEAAAFDVCNFS